MYTLSAEIMVNGLIKGITKQQVLKNFKIIKAGSL